jgi:nucleoside-diphosphate-sugar epimerase
LKDRIIFLKNSSTHSSNLSNIHECRLMKVCLTGSTGFVGSALARYLQNQDVEVLPIIRHATHNESLTVEKLAADPSALSGCAAVVHLASRVHVMRDKAKDPLSAYWEVNVDNTVSLASAAAAAGVPRFIFVSSIKVNGESTQAGRPFLFSDTPNPTDPYALSKWEAEQALHRIASETGLEIVIIRPPLIYGPGVKANFASMMRAVQRRLPLPLGAATGNRRSLVALDNLIDLLVCCIKHPAAAGQTFLVSDGEDLSSADLLLRLGVAMKKPARLFSIPLALIRLAAGCAGKSSMVERLLGNLQVDISHTCQTMAWVPPVDVDEGLRRASEALQKV